MVFATCSLKNIYISNIIYKYVYIDDCHENFGRFVASHNL